MFLKPIVEPLQSPLSLVTAYLGAQVSFSGSKPSHAVDEPVKNSISDFDWNALPPTTSLNYVPCYDGFECTRLEVPVDYKNATSTNKIQLALIRLPAVVPETDPNFGGTILYNPGGPAISGVDALRWNARGMRNVTDGEKFFELLSFDQRGAHRTSPQLECFTDLLSRSVWSFRGSIIEPSNVEGNFDHKWAMYRGLGDICEKNMYVYPDGVRLAKFAATTFVVQDMKRIIDEVQKYQSKITGKVSKLPALLNYWGESYGTAIGNFFVSMFPDRVGKVMIDSVVDPDDLVATEWLTSLQDLPKNVAMFFEDCFNAGPKCALGKFGFKSAQEMSDATDALLTKLKTEPVVQTIEGMPRILSFADIGSLLLEEGAYPNWASPSVAQCIAEAMDGEINTIYSYLPAVTAPTPGPEVDSVGQALLQGQNKTKAWPGYFSGWAETAGAIMCGDGKSIYNMSKEEYIKTRYNPTLATSSLAGWRWGENAMTCAMWPPSLRPDEHQRFTGPFQSKKSDYDPRSAEGVLMLGNTADPYSPIRNAFKASTRHEGSSVLVQHGAGHVTGYINPSACTQQYIRNFFATGKLPVNGTVCERNGSPWDFL